MHCTYTIYKKQYMYDLSSSQFVAPTVLNSYLIDHVVSSNKKDTVKRYRLPLEMLSFLHLKIPPTLL